MTEAHAAVSTSAVPFAITGRTRLTGVMGWPVSHTLSPAMHNAAFRSLGLDWAYVPLPVHPDRVADAVRGLYALGFAGANVTVPHKQAVMPLIDELTPIARAVGAVNTIVVRADGSLLGDSTDGAGFLTDLASQGVEPAAGPVIVLGSGGAARSVVFAFAEAGSQVYVVARSVEKAGELCQTVANGLPVGAPKPTAHEFPSALPALSESARLIVNATSLGLHADDPLPWQDGLRFRADQVVYDLIYNRPTRLLALAQADGARAIDGLGMLVHQGARAFELWTGMKAPVEVMAGALSR
jgi:shikimate dehydrogenase